MASTVPLAQVNALLAVPFSAHACAYCQSPIAAGQRWVREKIYESLERDNSHYQRYHADLYGDEVLSCWEKHQVQQQAAKAANVPKQ